jgi:hypothetical protein
MPTLTPRPATFCSSAAQVTLASGQPSEAATGCGTASTVGLCAIDGAAAGTRSSPTDQSRRSHVEESGIQMSGMSVVPLARPGPFSVTPCGPATAAATSPGSAAVTVTATHRPGPAIHWLAVSCTAGAISAAAATRSVTFPAQDAGWASMR